MDENSFSTARKIAECAIMIALATILSILEVVKLPYGGGITLASMLPLVVIGYRHGTKWGLTSSFVFGAISLVLGLNTLSYVTGVASVIAVIMLDYIVAFGVIGLSGFARKMQPQSKSLIIGGLIACFARYTCHVISGATVWAGLSIPTAAALYYSIIYNATYMLPETLILVVVAYYFGSSFDLKSYMPRPMIKNRNNTPQAVTVMKFISLTICFAALVIDIVSVFSKLQNAETGEFDITGIANVNLPLILIASGIALVVFSAYLILYFVTKKNNSPAENTEEEST